MIKKNDNVIVTAGKDKGKKGKVLKVFPKDFLIVVEGVNIRKKHQKPRQSGQKGEIIDKTEPIHVSNVMIVDPNSGKPTRVGKKLVGQKFIRVGKKSGKEL